MIAITKKVYDQINHAVELYKNDKEEFERIAVFLERDLANYNDLRELIHSSKHRAKDPDHLYDKLCRIAENCANKKRKFDITAQNLYTKIDDLAGVRLIHLYTDQMNIIHDRILCGLDEHRWRLVRKPVAYTWDIEYKGFFENLGIRTVRKDSMYTSVHYIVEPSKKTKLRCELQVRTLMEELWSEVSHTINYPHETDSISCKEQLKVLARISMGCTRLVDSIFRSDIEYKTAKK